MDRRFEIRGVDGGGQKVFGDVIYFGVLHLCFVLALVSFLGMLVWYWYYSEAGVFL